MTDSDDKDSQTEDATEKRLNSAVEDGNTPVSREASIFASLSAVLLILSFFLKDAVGHLVLALAHLIDDPGGWRLDNGADAMSLIDAVFGEAARLLVPIVALIMVSAFAVSFAQNPPRFVLKRIAPKWSKISPASGWKRLSGRPGQVEFLKSIAKFTAVILVVTMVLRAEQDNFLNAMVTDPSVLPSIVLGIVIRLLSAICIASVVLATLDLVWSRVHWRQGLRMSRRDIKDEFKEAEGDPLVKAKRRSLALDRSRRRMMAAIPRATLVIANPTHYAIALRYVREEGGAPMVLAKGQDLLALRIREIAKENDIPVIEDKALARSMYDHVDVDKMIPPEFYRAVAEIIHFIYSKSSPQARKR